MPIQSTLSDSIVGKIIIGIAAASASILGSTVIDNKSLNIKQEADISHISHDIEEIRCGVFSETPEEKLRCRREAGH